MGRTSMRFRLQIPRQQIKISSQPNTLGPQPKIHRRSHILPVIYFGTRNSLACARTCALHRSLYILPSSVTASQQFYHKQQIESQVKLYLEVTANSQQAVIFRHGLKISVMRMYRKRWQQRFNKAKYLWLHINAVTLETAYSSFPYLRICSSAHLHICSWRSTQNRPWRWRVTATCTNFGVYARVRVRDWGFKFRI